MVTMDGNKFVHLTPEHALCQLSAYVEIINSRFDHESTARSLKQRICL
ncbi:MAG: hypothetical protein KME28_20725 [Pelatocladus maniniholoensis HA4357-MV3]|uniref:Uncharacterized protein n=1 Tax=Pelatocladus maniniholoensis HA4357-MV3 TaxID=1117104 RepID=A0A9E3LUX8_9NOST|nr:hypothetical protein [Pelatocladus maniniholoensis HA4357-MV3]